MPREPVLRNICRCPRTSLPPRSFHPTDHVQQDIHPTNNQAQSVWKSWAVEARHRVGQRRGGLPSSAHQSLRTLVMQSSAPAPGAPSPWESALGAIEDSISQCTFLQMTQTAEKNMSRIVADLDQEEEKDKEEEEGRRRTRSNILGRNVVHTCLL